MRGMLLGVADIAISKRQKTPAQLNLQSSHNSNVNENANKQYMH